MKILLAYPPDSSLRKEINTEFPNSLGYISEILNKENKVKILVPDILRTKNIWKLILNIFNGFNPNVVGVSATSLTYASAVKMIKLFKKEKPNIKTIIGGVHPTALLQKTLKEIKELDFLVYGEGERTIKELINELKKKDPKFGKIKGLAFRQKGKIKINKPRGYIQDLDSIPFVDKRNIIGKEHIPIHEFGQTIFSRGCPFHCIFCGAHLICGKKLRLRSAENVIKEIESIKNTFGTKKFIFKDSVFTLNRNAIDNLLDLMIEKNLNIKWGCNTRADLVDEALLRKMKKAGCEFIAYGVESVGDGTLKKLKKEINIKQIKNTFKLTKKEGIQIIAYFMVGFPWENEKDIKKTVKEALKLKADKIIISSAIPLPNTELEYMSKKIDWLRYNPKKYPQEAINLTNLTNKKYSSLINKLLRKVSFYNKKKKIINKLKFLYNLFKKGKFKKIFNDLKMKHNIRHILSN